MKSNAATDTLLILAPPVRLVAWLEKVFDAKRHSGQEVPENFTKWLDRWNKIRAGLPVETDVLTIEEWQQVDLLLEKIDAKDKLAKGAY